MANRQGFQPMNLTNSNLTMPACIKFYEQIKHTSFPKKSCSFTPKPCVIHQPALAATLSGTIKCEPLNRSTDGNRHHCDQPAPTGGCDR